MNDLEQFKQDSVDRVKEYNSNYDLQSTKNQFHDELVKVKYAHNFFFMGVPIIQEPQDLQAMQEIIFETKPNIIIETGIAWGGSLVFCASMLKLLNRNYTCVYGIDIEIKQHTKDIINKHSMSSLIQMFECSSIDEKILQIFDDLIKRYNKYHDYPAKVMIHLDSNHTHEHVLQELRMYASLVSKGCYMIVDDTGIEDLPEGSTSDRPWGKGNNPATAVFEFLKKNKDFEMDTNIPNKLLLTGTPYGYLRKIK